MPRADLDFRYSETYRKKDLPKQLRELWLDDLAFIHFGSCRQPIADRADLNGVNWSIEFQRGFQSRCRFDITFNSLKADRNLRLQQIAQVLSYIREIPRSGAQIDERLSA